MRCKSEVKAAKCRFRVAFSLEPSRWRCWRHMMDPTSLRLTLVSTTTYHYLWVSHWDNLSCKLKNIDPICKFLFKVLCLTGYLSESFARMWSNLIRQMTRNTLYTFYWQCHVLIDWLISWERQMYVYFFLIDGWNIRPWVKHWNYDNIEWE